MDTSSVSPSPNFATAQVMTNVEKNDKAQSQVKPVAAGSESANAALGEKELHQRNAAAKKNEESQDFEAMSKVAKEIQERLDLMGSSLGFSVYNKHETIVAEISNRESGELIKQIPSEEVLRLREKIEEMVGLLLDEKA